MEKEIEAYAKFSSRDLQNVIVIYDFDLTRYLPTKLGDITVRYLTEPELVEEYKKLGRVERGQGVPFIKIFPISDKDDKLFFAYNNYWFRHSEKGGFLSKKKLISSWGLEGGCHAEIGFDSIERKLFIKRVELWGV